MQYTVQRRVTALVGLLVLLSPSLGFGAGVSGTIVAKKKFLKNNLVYVERAPGNFPPPAKPATINQKNQAFDPFLLPILVGTTVTFLNEDNTVHNVFTPDGEKYDLGAWPKGESRSYTYKTEGFYSQLCKLHPSMLAYVAVLQNPFFAVTGDDGTFKINDLPPGSYTLKVWSERLKAKPLPIKVGDAGLSGLSIELGH